MNDILLERIKADSLAFRKAVIAGKSGPADLLAVTTIKSNELLSLLGELGSKQKTFSPERDLRLEEITAIIRKFLTNVEDSLRDIDKLPAERRDVERSKLVLRRSVLEVYMPKQMDRAELEAFIGPLAAEGRKIGEIMAALKAQRAGLYNGQEASAVIKALMA